jgi:NosR/NirI family transcriptional regulator, nitrous oxide reductase regulator
MIDFFQSLCRRRWGAAACVLLLLAAGVAGAGDLIPVPEFKDHAIPVAQPPAPSTIGGEWGNLLALLVALSLASYFALVSRSRRGLFLLTIASLLWFGFVRQGCVCPIGATQNVAYALVDRTYAIPVSIVALFSLPLVFTLFFGRTFCAAVCPLGAMQELVAVGKTRVPSWLDHALGLVPYIYLGVALVFACTGTAFLICRYDPFIAMMRRTGDRGMLIFGASLLTLGIFVGRPYCRYLCPYGGLLALLSKLAKWHARIPPENCIRCRLCEDVCPYGAIQEPTLPQTADQRPAARRRVLLLLLGTPVLVAAGAVLGLGLAIPLSRLDPEYRLAERIRLEDAGRVSGTTDASEAFRNTGQPFAKLYAQAKDTANRYRRLGVWLGAWIGLVVGVKLLALAIHRKRTDYQPDQGRCVSCGRCYWYCPEEQVRLGLIQDVSQVVDVSTLAASAERDEG